MQEGDRLDELGTFEWPKNVVVDLEPVEVTSTSNASLMLAASEQGTLSTDSGSTRVRIWNSSDSNLNKFRLRWDGDDSESPEIYVPSGKSVLLALLNVILQEPPHSYSLGISMISITAFILRQNCHVSSILSTWVIARRLVQVVHFSTWKGYSSLIGILPRV